MPSEFRTVIAVVLISLGGVLLGRGLSQWVQHKLTRAHLVGALLCGIGVIGYGVTYRLRGTEYPNAEAIGTVCVLLLLIGALIETWARTRTTQ